MMRCMWVVISVFLVNIMFTWYSDSAMTLIYDMIWVVRGGVLVWDVCGGRGTGWSRANSGEPGGDWGA